MKLADHLGEFIRSAGSKLSPGIRRRLISLWVKLRNPHDKKVRVLPGGLQITCDLSVPYECMVWLKQEEENELEILTRLLQPGDIFIDCGANIGIWTLVAASIVAPVGEVYSFEPNPVTSDKLAANIAAGRRGDPVNNIHVVRACVGNVIGKANLEVSRSHNESRVVKEPNAHTIVVPILTLDAAVRNERVTGCKIDVEGYELPVILGARNMLSSSRPWLCIEFYPRAAGVERLGQWGVHRELVKLGYVARLFRNALQPTRENILNDDWGTGAYCNLYYSTIVGM